MSAMSGKCDLLDHILMEKMYDLGNIKKSDELECFNIFKQKTGGVIYQMIKVPFTEWNFDKFAEIEKAKENTTYKLEKKVEYLDVPDKRCKSGFRKVEDVTYCADYFGRVVEAKTIEELNKQVNYYFRKEIKFDTIFDILPYYPYIVSTAYSNHNKEYIVISNKSFVESEFEDLLKGGYISGMYNYYKKDLQAHYKELIDKYGDELFNPDYKYNSEDRSKLI